MSAIKKLIINGLLNVDTNGNYTPMIVFDNTIDTLSIPYQKTIDTPKEKDKETDNNKATDNVEDIVLETEKAKDISKMSKQEISQSFDELFNN